MAGQNVTMHSGETGAAADLFDFRPHWKVLQQFFDCTGRIPGDPDAFEGRYGPFADMVAVSAFVSAVRQAHDLAARLGNPASLKQRLARTPDYLFQSAPPEEAYSQIVWLASQTGNLAHTIANAFPLLEGLLSPATSTAERAASLRRVLSGPGGLAATAGAAAAQVESVRDTLAALTTQFNGVLQMLHRSQAINQANIAIGELQSALARLNRQSDEAKEKAKHWLGRGKTEKEQLEHEEQIAAKTADLNGKQKLVDDTSDLFTAGNGVAPALAAIDDKLRKLGKLFSAASDRFSMVSQISSQDQLSNYTWLAQALDFPAAWQRWQHLNDAARQFVQGAMIDLNTSA